MKQNITASTTNIHQCSIKLKITNTASLILWPRVGCCELLNGVDGQEVLKLLLPWLRETPSIFWDLHQEWIKNENIAWTSPDFVDNHRRSYESNSYQKHHVIHSALQKVGIIYALTRVSSPNSYVHFFLHFQKLCDMPHGFTNKSSDDNIFLVDWKNNSTDLFEKLFRA